MRRTLYLLLFMLNLLLLPLGLLGLMFWLAMPMTMAFLVPFTIENRTAGTIEVTPIGATGSAGHRSRLPLYFSRFLPYLSPWSADFSIAPGKSRTLVYDFDDTQFSEIVIRDSSGHLGQLVVEADPTTRQYHTPATRNFVVDNPISALPAPPPKVVAAVEAARHPVYVTLSIPFLPIPLLTVRWTYRRWKQAQRGAAMQPASAAGG